MDSFVSYLCNFFCCSLNYPRWHIWWIVTGTTVRRGSPFQNTWTLGIWVLDYFSDLHDEPAGRTVMETMVCHALCNPTQEFSIFLQQLHYDATYGPSRTRRTVTIFVGGTFLYFLLKNLHIFSSTDWSIVMDVRNTNNSSIEEAKKRVMVLPFQSLSFAFNHILMYTKQLCLFPTSIQLTHYFNTFSSSNVGPENKSIEWSISKKILWSAHQFHKPQNCNSSTTTKFQ